MNDLIDIDDLIEDAYLEDTYLEDAGDNTIGGSIEDLIDQDDSIDVFILNENELLDMIIGGDSLVEIDDSPVSGGDSHVETGDSSVSGSGPISFMKNIINPPVKVAPGTIPKKVTECSLINENGGVCTSGGILNKIKNTLSINKNNPEEVVEEAKKKTECDSERCVLKNKAVLQTLGSHVVNDELSKNFKLPGPVGIELLTNHNIDKTLRQWQAKFPKFYAYNFNMRDFKREGDTLATVDVYRDIYNKGYETFACVINSDRYSGQGIHWMALFGDFRNKSQFTVEFFNSSGQSPVREFAEWLMDTKDRMEDIIRDENLADTTIKVVNACSVKQQSSRTECGPYSLYYIWSRLNNVSYEFFLQNRIEDQSMFEFRQHLFHSSNAEFKPGEEFDFSKFEEKFSPKWERGEEPNKR